MCMAPDIPDTPAPIVPESVKRVGKEQRRTTAANTAAANTAASATDKTKGAGGTSSGEKKSLLGA